MCGIFCYHGSGDAAQEILLGLKRLEYRGYDSWGIAVLNGSEIDCERYVGAVSQAERLGSNLNAATGIGHTRWATHGEVAVHNTHPLRSSSGDFAVAHNGIVENYQELRSALEKSGYDFQTGTDTEVILALIEQHSAGNGAGDALVSAVCRTFSQLAGRNAVVILDRHRQRIIGVRDGSPLAVGIGDNAVFVASDVLSFSHRADRVAALGDRQLVICNGSRSIHCCQLESGAEVTVEFKPAASDRTEISCGEHPHFMLKEILQQPQTILDAAALDLEELQRLVDAVNGARNLFVVAAGGACFAAQQVAYLLRAIAGRQAHGVSAYEFAAYGALLRRGDVVLAVSQSGETADTLDALEAARRHGLHIAAVVNMPEATISRMAEFSFTSNSGPEVCVISTKTSSAQMVFGYMLAMMLAHRYDEGLEHIQTLSSALPAFLSNGLRERIGAVAARIRGQRSIFLLGKGRNYHIAGVGAHNIKEASYYHAEGLAAGELKHGALALVVEGTPVICFVDADPDREYMLAAAAEVKCRGAHVIGLSTHENRLFDDFIPLPTLLERSSGVVVNNIPCQLLAYELAVQSGINPDRPRNLAKSVTVR